MYVAGPELRRQTVAVPVEEQQGIVAGGCKVPVVGALLPLDRNVGRIQVQHRSIVPVDGFDLANQLLVDSHETREALLLRWHLRLEGL